VNSCLILIKIRFSPAVHRHVYMCNWWESLIVILSRLSHCHSFLISFLLITNTSYDTVNKQMNSSPWLYNMSEFIFLSCKFRLSRQNINEIIIDIYLDTFHQILPDVKNVRYLIKLFPNVSIKNQHWLMGIIMNVSFH
jgi:hypothetical protein